MLNLSRREAVVAAISGAALHHLGRASTGTDEHLAFKPVRVMTSGAPGTAPDLAARIWSEKLSARWKQPVVIDNKPGGDGVIAVQAMLAARDGHTLFFGPHFIYTVLHNTNQDIAIKPRDEMVPICATNLDFIGIAVSPKIPVASLAELKDYSRTRPDTLSWSAPQGSTLWLLMKDFIDRAGLRTLYVPYRSSPQAVVDLTEDRLQVVMLPLAQLVGQVEAGKAKLIATAGTQTPARSAQYADSHRAGLPRDDQRRRVRILRTKGYVRGIDRADRGGCPRGVRRAGHGRTLRAPGAELAHRLDFAVHLRAGGLRAQVRGARPRYKYKSE